MVERALGLRAEGVIDFSSNVNPYGPSPKAIRALLDKIWMIGAYPDDEARALKERLAERYGLRPSNFVVGNGSTEIIYAFSMLVVREGPVGVHIPTFSEYRGPLGLMEAGASSRGPTCTTSPASRSSWS